MHTCVRMRSLNGASLWLVQVEKWKDEVRRLRRLLETERAHLRKSRAAYVTAVSEKTDLQSFLRQCISDVQVPCSGDHGRWCGFFPSGIIELQRSSEDGGGC